MAAGKYLCEWDHWFVAIVVAAFRRAVESAAFDPAFGAFFNAPLLAVAWVKIDREFTIMTVCTVVLSSVMMKVVPVIALTTDPVICAVFGGLLHGVSVGLTLNDDFSTGGLDILGILVKKATGRSIGSFFIGFNVSLQLAAGLIFGWPYAFYSAISFFISGRMVDYVNLKQRRVQLLVVTEKAEPVITTLQCALQRGITVINDVEGGFDHQQKNYYYWSFPIENSRPSKA